MGYSLAALAYSTWGDLPDRPFRLLVHMSLQAKDSDPQPRFFGSRAGMCYALGYKEPTNAARQSVKRAVATLREAGAIDLDKRAQTGQQAKFKLILNRPDRGTPTVPQSVDSPEDRGTPTVPDCGTASDPTGVRPVTRQGYADRTPKEEDNHLERNGENNSSPKVSKESATAGEVNGIEIDVFRANEILRRAADEGVVDVAAIIAAAPESLTKKSERRAWAAQQIAAKEAS